MNYLKKIAKKPLLWILKLILIVVEILVFFLVPKGIYYSDSGEISMITYLLYRRSDQEIIWFTRDIQLLQARLLNGYQLGGYSIYGYIWVIISRILIGLSIYIVLRFIFTLKKKRRWQYPSSSHQMEATSSNLEFARPAINCCIYIFIFFVIMILVSLLSQGFGMSLVFYGFFMFNQFGGGLYITLFNIFCGIVSIIYLFFIIFQKRQKTIRRMDLLEEWNFDFYLLTFLLNLTYSNPMWELSTYRGMGFTTYTLYPNWGESSIPLQAIVQIPLLIFHVIIYLQLHYTIMAQYPSSTKKKLISKYPFKRSFTAYLDDSKLVIQFYPDLQKILDEISQQQFVSAKETTKMLSRMYKKKDIPLVSSILDDFEYYCDLNQIYSRENQIYLEAYRTGRISEAFQGIVKLKQKMDDPMVNDLIYSPLVSDTNKSYKLINNERNNRLREIKGSISEISQLIAQNSKQVMDSLEQIRKKATNLGLLDIANKIHTQISIMVKIQNLNKFFKVSSRIAFSDIAAMVYMERDELLQMLIKFAGDITNIKIDGDDLVLENSDEEIFFNGIDNLTFD